MRCKDNSSDPNDSNSIIYQNSFESSSDLLGWYSLDSNLLVNVHAPGCGNKSLHIGGGCIQPVTFYSLIVPQNGLYQLSCWVKGDTIWDNGGQIFLRKSSKYNYQSGSYVFVKSSEWKFIEGVPELEFSKGDTMFIDIMAGGKMPSYIFVDNLKVEKIQ